MSAPAEHVDQQPSPAPSATAGTKGIFGAKSFRERGTAWKVGIFFGVVGLVMLGISWYWSREPARFDVVEVAAEAANIKNPKELPLGYTYSTALIEIADTVLHKPGGFLTNDVFPPSVMLDNIPNWELGALIALRDATTALRNNISRSQTQSREDPDLAKGEPFFYFDHKSWQLPSSESEYEKGVEALEGYRERLMKRDANFYARADNLRQYLEILEKRMGDYSNRLSASTADAPGTTEERRPGLTKTPWLKIDDVFFEARGYSWAAMHVLKAIEFDFRDILSNKTALVSLQQIIRELENSQASYLSPVILNGSGFGLFANYSLTLANYIARANAATIDLRSLLQQG
ncbi:DUF2333 family protein [Methylomagnum ishizawai]|uniref:DUF2333 family protein n=1 Tax=Methylomagnum ishizawai TaxID=1760988 RepID=UPI001C33EB12|nr:DUF2333 family protein [Methylomagnum ishizawai]BBL75710.1 hypothetical protein MishRS11D_28080 [Methylomagnum ishizawai]